ncbi:MAG TPA: IS701 family transposase [Streptosporangiaceae bacterium]|nr:IS701 family transposase [Streptosporangiaceae bacterium]
MTSLTKPDTIISARRKSVVGDAISQFCDDLFSSFLRSDQRRWGEVYLRGLISVSGRRSIRRISEQVVGWRADQCLQQFVNQSPWKWEPVRARLAQQVDAALRPKAWVVEEVVFPKCGTNSVGVEKQYAHSAGRVLNCQLGLSVFLVGEDGSCPVNWRLLLPRSWDGDAARRSSAHVPDNERHRSRWDQLLDAVDEMSADWDLIPAPVVIDAQHVPHVEPLLEGLEKRGLGYVVRVAENTPTAAPATGTLARAQTIGDVVAQSVGRTEVTLSWPGGAGGRLIRSRFVVALLPGPAASHELGQARARRRQRRVIADWSPNRRRSKAVWLTNLNVSRLPDLIGLIRLRRRTGEELARMNEHSGLRHFEGRSYRGWHHHVTLVSAAHGYLLLGRLADSVGDDWVAQYV